MSAQRRIHRELGACCRLAPLLLTLPLGCHETTKHPHEPALKVAAAADLSLAFKQVGAAYEKSTGKPVLLSFGASGLLEKQIAEGAPFDVFAAADVSFVDDAIRAGACLADTRATYARGRLVLFAADGAPVTPRGLSDLADPRVRKIAIANPQHAPYGRAAQQAMERAGLWDRVRPKVVFGENVQQTLEFAQSGNVDIAIVALSLAQGVPGHVTPVPAELHDPLEQAAVVCSHGQAGTAAGKSFLAFVQSPAGRAILHRFGFGLPGESASAGASPGTHEP